MSEGKIETEEFINSIKARSGSGMSSDYRVSRKDMKLLEKRLFAYQYHIELLKLENERLRKELLDCW